MAAMTTQAIVTFVGIVSCFVGAIQPVVATMEDGLPRPANIADAPFVSHGARPEVRYPDGAVANCKWYGFINTHYSESSGVACINELRTGLTNASPDLILEPFVYYYLAGATGSDPATDERYCYEGCFNLELDGGSASPPALDSSPAPSPGGNFFRGPSVAPSFSPEQSPIASPAFAPAPESGA